MLLLTLDQIDPLNFRLERAVPNVAAQAPLNESRCLKARDDEGQSVAAAPIPPPEPLEAGHQKLNLGDLVLAEWYDSKMVFTFTRYGEGGIYTLDCEGKEMWIRNGHFKKIEELLKTNWVQWDGNSGKCCPVNPSDRVEVKFDDNSIGVDLAESWAWDCSWAPIIAYRLVLP